MFLYFFFFLEQNAPVETLLYLCLSVRAHLTSEYFISSLLGIGEIRAEVRALLKGEQPKAQAQSDTLFS